MTPAGNYWGLSFYWHFFFGGKFGFYVGKILKLIFGGKIGVFGRKIGVFGRKIGLFEGKIWAF